MPRYDYTYKAINRFMGKALHHYDMLGDGDRIVVGLSGGKDSLTLMWMLNERRKRIPINYEVIAVHIDPGFEGANTDALGAFCREQGYAYRIEHTDYGPLSHSTQNRENPCFLCSRLRRKRLFEVAAELNCRKIALGHNKDDVIETLFLNICYAGEISTMRPVQPFFKGKYTVIRPLAYVDEAAIAAFVRRRGWPVFENPCPSKTVSKRREIKDMLNALYRHNRKIKGNIFRAMSHVKSEYLLKP